METVEAKLEVVVFHALVYLYEFRLMNKTVYKKKKKNVAKSVDTTFSQETGDRFVSTAPLFKPCLAFLRPLHAF